MSEPDDGYSLAWHEFTDEFARAMSDDEVINIAINQWRQQEHETDERKRWSLVLWIAAVFACGKAERILRGKVPPL